MQRFIALLPVLHVRIAVNLSVKVRETRTRAIKCYTPYSIGGLIFTSNRISRLFLSGPAGGGIEKMRSIFFQKTKSSGVPVTKPAGLRQSTTYP